MSVQTQSRENLIKLILAGVGLVFIVFFIYLWIVFSALIEKEKNEEYRWGHEFQKYEQVLALLDAVHIPLNDSFNSKDLEFEKNRFERYKIEYLEQSNLFLKEIKIHLKADGQLPLTIESIGDFEADYFIFGNNLFYFLNKNKKEYAFEEYMKAFSMHRSIQDNILEIRSHSIAFHENIIGKIAKDKKDLLKWFSAFSFLLFLSTILIYYLFDKILKTLSHQTNILKNQMKELEVLKFAVDNFLLISKADVNGDITYINKLFEDISGFNFSELKGKNHRLIKSDHHDSLFFKVLWETINAGKIWRGQIKNKTKNGNYYWVESCILPIKDNEGNIEEFISIRSDITKQKELESSLIDKNIFYQSLLSNMTEGLVAQDFQGNIILCNNSAAYILERSPEELLSKNSADVDWQAIKSDGSDYPASEHPSIQVLSGKLDHAHGIMGLKFKDRIKWIEINSTPIYSEDKLVKYSLTTFFDVTLKTNQMNLNLAIIQLKEAYLRHQHSTKDFFNFLVFSLHNVFKADYVYLAHTHKNSSVVKLTYGNSFYEVYGDDDIVNFDVIIPDSFKILPEFISRVETLASDKDIKIHDYITDRINFSIFHSIDNEIERYSLLTFKKNNFPHTLIFIGFKKDNSYFNYGMNRQSYFQTLDQMISSAIDEDALRNEKAKLQFTLTSSGVYFFEINLTQRKIIADSKFLEKLYFSTEDIDLSVEDFLNIFSKDRRNTLELENMIDDLFNHRDFFERRLYLTTITKLEEIYVLKGKRSLDAGDVRYLCTLIDDTKKANLEDEIQKQKDIVYQNQKLAAIGELAAGVGHEINNPLTIISGHIQKIRKQIVPENKKDFAEDVLQGMEKSILRIKNIVSGLRKFSHANAIEAEVVDLYLCLTDVVDMVKDIYLADGVNLKFDSKADTFYVLGNFGKIQQVVINLMNNARDALKETNKKNKSIEVILKNVGSKVVLEVLDNGTGIPEAAKGKIFNAFYTTKDVGEGTGLGLSIVHNIIKEHNAKIEIDSVLNEYTKFIITFDQFVMDSKDSADGTSSIDMVNITKIEQISDLAETLSGKSILVVEDEDAIRDIIKDILEEYKVKIVEVENGLLALEEIAKTNFDLVLTDMKMPVMSGIELLEKVKEFENIELKRFVIMSGGVNLALDNLKLELGFSDILNKPFNDNDLILKVYLTLKKIHTLENAKQ